MLVAMAFQRKWVSDSNLDKLWNETIEKKEANKQRRSPDFCKEAILSETLKRISSEMLMRRFSSTVLDMEQDFDGDDSVAVISEIDGLSTCEGIQMTADVIYGSKKVSAEKENAFPSVESSEKLSMPQINTDEGGTLTDMSDVHIVHYNYPDSPKRKRNELEDDDILSSVSSQKVSSPAKRPCRLQRTCRRNKPASLYRNRSLSPVRNTSKDGLLLVTAMHVNKPGVLGANTENKDCDFVPCSDDSTHTALTPVKSVVSSISALTLGVSENHATGSMPWCLPGTNNSNDDPLELDSFFKNLKNVPS